MTRPRSAVAHRHIHDAPRSLDFVARVKMRVFAEQHDADFVLVHVECNAKPTTRKRHAVPRIRRWGGRSPWRCRWTTLVIVPTSRGDSRAVKAFRAVAIAANVRVDDAREVLRRRGHPFCRLQDVTHAPFHGREISVDTPDHLLSIGSKLDSADEIRRCLEA